MVCLGKVHLIQAFGLLKRTFEDGFRGDSFEIDMLHVSTWIGQLRKWHRHSLS